MPCQETILCRSSTPVLRQKQVFWEIREEPAAYRLLVIAGDMPIEDVVALFMCHTLSLLPHQQETRPEKMTSICAGPAGVRSLLPLDKIIEHTNVEFSRGGDQGELRVTFREGLLTVVIPKSRMRVLDSAQLVRVTSARLTKQALPDAVERDVPRLDR